MTEEAKLIQTQQENSIIQELTAKLREAEELNKTLHTTSTLQAQLIEQQEEHINLLRRTVDILEEQLKSLPREEMSLPLPENLNHLRDQRGKQLLREEKVLSQQFTRNDPEREIQPIRLFYCYASQDRKLREQLETHLMVLKRLRRITLQLNREITAGTNWRHVQDERFQMADLILLLISPDFIASAYHYGIEMHNALEKQKAGNVRVLPILLRPTPLWQETPLGVLQILPKSGKAITEYPRRDKVLAEIVKAISEEIFSLLMQEKITKEN